jgi:YD repeat-containing protein
MRTFWIVPALVYVALIPIAHAGVTYTYDTLGRLSLATYDNGKTITYTYDPAGNRTQVATANSAPRGAIARPSAKPKKKRKH